jgi:glycosyltransferase involved in cell wall biosynthesis
MQQPPAKQPPAKHVTFVYVGRLQSRGRLLKQIATLQGAGVTCDVVLGNTIAESPDQAEFNFPITALPVNEDASRLLSFVNQLRFCRAAARKVAAGRADTVVCLGLEALPAGVWAKQFRPSLSLVFDNNELHIESFEKGIKPVVWKPIHNWGVRRSDVILHAEHNRRDYFRKHYPGSEKPQLVIENFPFFGEPPAQRTAPTEKVRVIYLGGFGACRFTEEIIDSFSKLPATISLDIVGYGRPEYVARLSRSLSDSAAEHIRLLPAVPYSGISELLANYDVGVALYRNTNLNNYYCAPNKVYDYLMNGMPMIANRYPGLVSVIEENRVGVCVETVDATSLGRAVESIVSNRMWENITPELRKRYSWEQQEANYLAVFGR